MAFQAVAAPTVLSWQHNAEGRCVSACSTQNVLHIRPLKIAYAVEHVKRLVQLTLGHCALTEVAHFHSGSYALGFSVQSVLPKMEWTWKDEGNCYCQCTGEVWWQGIVSSDIIVYLNASECQISRYSMPIVTNIQAGKWTPALPHPKPLTFFFSLRQYNACLE